MDAAEALVAGIQNITLDEGYQLVAAIDFGTTYSAYAFSFKCSPDDIHMNKNWGSTIGFESYKTPTSVLTKPGGDFDSFGYEAEEKFSRLEGNQGGPNGYNLYRNFKMVLHKNGAKMTSTITSTSGNTCLALDIFIMAITYLKDHMLEAIKKAVVRPIEMSQIRWVLTVPAIWSEESKKFMRTAAYWSDLIPEENSKRLMMVLEPEAASIHCRGLEIGDFVEKSVQQKEEIRFRSGQKLLVIDAGGGTIDITAHEILRNGDVKELIHPYGGPFGGAKVDDNFVTALEGVLGAKFLKDYRKLHPEDWIRFLISFEKRKKAITPYEESSVRLPLSWLMAREFKSFSGKDIEQAFAETNVPGITLNFHDGTIVISYDKMKEILYSVISQITNLVKQVISKEKKINNISYIFLVGGFSECTFLQEECMKTLSKYAPVLIPLSAQVAVLKGAVTFGHKPWQVLSRISRSTYGCQQELPFIDGIHDPKKMIEVNGKKKCVDLFKPFVKKDDEIKLGKTITFKCKPAKPGDRKIEFFLYSANRSEVKYIDEPGVQELGNIRLKSKHGPLSDDLEVRLTFGFTELFVEAIDKKKDSKTSKTSVDFLSKAMAPPRYHSSKKKSQKKEMKEQTIL